MKISGSIIGVLIGLALFARAEMRVASHAPRVASLAPSLTELVFALGAGSNLVARSSACDYPEAARALPVAGDFGRPGVEFLRELQPDILLVTDLENPAIRSALDELEIRTLVLPCEGWNALLDAARVLGRELDAGDAGTRWIDAMTRRRAALQDRVRAFWKGRARPRVYFEVWGDPLTTPGGTSFVDDMIGLAGGVNLAHAIEENYAHVSPEWVVLEDPDVTVLAHMATAAPDRGAALRARPGLRGLRGVQEDSVCSSIPPELLLRPGPRMIEGAEKLADWLMRWAGRQKTEDGRRRGR